MALQSQCLCWAPVSLSSRWAEEGAYILVSIGFDELRSYLEGDFLHDKPCREPVNYKSPASAIRANQGFLIKGAVVRDHADGPR